MKPILRQSILRHLLRHPWQCALAIIGIALGVALLVAVDLANRSAKASFDHSLSMISGQASHSIIASSGGISHAFYRELRVTHGFHQIAPIVQAKVEIEGRPFTLLGIDPLAEQPFRSPLVGEGLAQSSRWFTQPGQIILAHFAAQTLGLKSGDTLRLNYQEQSHQVQIAHLLPEGHPMAAAALLMTDIATAQELLGRLSHIDRIDLQLADPEKIRQLRALLPANLQLHESQARQQTLTQITQAFHTNLDAMSLLALLVGGFLIFNTMTFMVLQQRKLLGTLRSLGVRKAQIFFLILSEAALLGAAGTLLGLVLGVLLGQGLLSLVIRTINDLYYSLEMSRFELSPLSLFKGVLLGVGVSLASALLPAWEAARTLPASVMRVSSLTTPIQRGLARLVLIGLGLMAAGFVTAYGAAPTLHLGFTALALVVLGYCLTIPWQLKQLIALGSRLAARSPWHTGTYSLRQMSGGLSRTGPAVAALSIAVATTLGVSLMIGSFRGAVTHWLDDALSGDIYVSLNRLTGQVGERGLPSTLPTRLKAIPTVQGAWAQRSTRVETSWGPLRLMAISDYADNPRGFNLIAGDAGTVRTQFFAGAGILISEPLAYHQGLQLGDRIRLHSAHGPDDYPVLGIFQDYTSSQGLILMPLNQYQNRWRDHDLSAIALYLKPGAELEASLSDVAAQVRLLPLQANLEVTRSGEIKRHSLAVFDRTFSITQVLRLLTLIVAFIGILSALMALQLERTREYALFRATGMTPAEIASMIRLQTGVLGLCAGMLALPLGVLMAHLLIDIINRRSFGWSMSLDLAFTPIMEALILAVLAAWAASLYPARRSTQLNLAKALHDE